MVLSDKNVGFLNTCFKMQVFSVYELMATVNEH